MLKFTVNNQIITRKDDFRVVADSKNYLEATFELTEEWLDDTVVLFGYGEEYFCVLLDEQRSCIVPAEVIKPPFFTVSLFCGDDVFVTANTVTVDVEKSGFTEGSEPETPTPDVWQMYMARMQDMIGKACPYIGSNNHWFLYDVEEEAYVDAGILAKGYTPLKGVDYWTEEDKAEIKTYVEDAILGGAW
ncbi:MAG: hypothetical protein IJN96_02950 [Clostridia bacterium]|nr:hypothetical protein [Clostridia bacterium]